MTGTPPPKKTTTTFQWAPIVLVQTMNGQILVLLFFHFSKLIFSSSHFCSNLHFKNSYEIFLSILVHSFSDTFLQGISHNRMHHVCCFFNRYIHFYARFLLCMHFYGHWRTAPQNSTSEECLCFGSQLVSESANYIRLPLNKHWVEFLPHPQFKWKDSAQRMLTTTVLLTLSSTRSNVCDVNRTWVGFADSWNC